MVLHINITLPEDDVMEGESTSLEHEICVSEEFSCVSKTQIAFLLHKIEKVLDSQGISCFQCP